MSLRRDNILLANQREMVEDIGRLKQDHADTRTVIKRVVAEHVPEMIRSLIIEGAAKAASERHSGAVHTTPVRQQDIEMGEASNRPPRTPQKCPPQRPPTPPSRLKAAAEGDPSDSSDSSVESMNLEDEEYWRNKLRKAAEKRKSKKGWEATSPKSCEGRKDPPLLLWLI